MILTLSPMIVKQNQQSTPNYLINVEIVLNCGWVDVRINSNSAISTAHRRTGIMQARQRHLLVLRRAKHSVADGVHLQPASSRFNPVCNTQTCANTVTAPGCARFDVKPAEISSRRALNTALEITSHRPTPRPVLAAWDPVFQAPVRWVKLALPAPGSLLINRRHWVPSSRRRTRLPAALKSTRTSTDSQCSTYDLHFNFGLSNYTALRSRVRLNMWRCDWDDN